MARRTATGPNGEKLELKNGQWVPLPTSELAAAQQSFSGQDTDRSARAQTIKTAGATAVANVLGLPHAVGELLSIGGVRPLTGPGAAITDALLKMPEPDAVDVLSATRGIAKLPGAVARGYVAEGEPPPDVQMTAARSSVSDAMTGARAAEEDAAAERPVATSVGRTAGDVATMLSLRPTAGGIKSLLALPRSAPKVAEETMSALKNAAQVFARGLGRTTEAGLEGALIGALGDGDPAKTAAWSAGMQAGGSLALAAKNTLLRNPMKSFGALWIGHEMWKSAAPGPQNAFDSKDAAINELVAAFGLGTTAALAGASRGVGAGTIRQVTNALSSVSRASVASVITQLQESKDEPQYERVIAKVAEDPDYFGSEVRMRLERAARSERPQQLLREIDRLMDSTRFRKLYDEISAE
jgi:hypothetical protein